MGSRRLLVSSRVGLSRVESRRQMVAHLRELLSETKRKNGRTLAEAAGDSGPQGSYLGRPHSAGRPRVIMAKLTATTFLERSR
jgi:hypothetical protein